MPADHDHADHEGHDHTHADGPGSATEYVKNWSSFEGSFAKKCGLAFRNLTVGRMRHGTCCGHYGEPGC